MRVATKKRNSSRPREDGGFFVKWHFFAPFFLGVVGLFAAFTILFFTSMHNMFEFYQERQSAETRDTLENAVAERQRYLRNYLSFIKDDADFKNAFYYASEDLVSLKKPLADYLLKYKPLLGVDYVRAVTAEGETVYAEEGDHAGAGGLDLPFDLKDLPRTEIETRLVLLGDTPHLAASIPVHSFDKMAGYLLVGFDFGVPFLEELRAITGHHFYFLDAEGEIAASTVQDSSFREALLDAMGDRARFPVEMRRGEERYFISALPMSESGRGPRSGFTLYAVGDMSGLKAFQSRMILNALLILLVIATIGFYVSYLSSRVLSGKVNRLLADLQDYRSKIEQQKKLSALGELAAQISHDIRSPLAALDSVTGKTSELPEEQRLIVRGAVGRIHDIANHLLEDRTAGNDEIAADDSSGHTASPAQEAVCLLSSLLGPVITEKRLQFRSRLGVEIDAQLSAASYGHFARVAPAEFKRVLSNLIDNGVEALTGTGTVSVELARDADRIVVRVRDDGRGIPSAIREKLGRRGESHGKPGGSGLGLYHAKTCAEAWGGTLAIASEPGKGTAVSLRLPPAPPPTWFVSELRLEAGTPVAVLDDDPTIHQVWQRRLEPLVGGTRGMDVLHFSSARELRAWVRADPKASRRAVYLLDYELQGSAKTGLSLAKELGLGERSILVTSRFEEKAILDECIRFGIRMIPKGLAGFVPVALERPAAGDPDGVLIDDDGLVRKTWQLAARTSGKKLRAFSHPSEFLAAAGGIAKNTPIYVDSLLGENLRGEEFAKDLHVRGFRNLYLATARAKKSLPEMPWIKEVVGKRAPWG